MNGNEHLRIGHAERDDAQRLLAEAVEDGRITPEEFAERKELAASAKTVGDLNAILNDLRPSPSASPVPSLDVASAAPGYHPDDPLILSAVSTTQKRGGPWAVPPYLQAHPLMANVRIDLQLATAQTPVIELDVRAGHGRTLLILPEGWGVDVARLSSDWGSVSVKVPGEPAWGQPLIRVRGSVGWGAFVARLASRRERARAGLDR
jgi:hypothetical protein